MATYDSAVTKIESDMKWQQEEAQLQQREERKARESLARESERAQSSYDADIRAAVSRQDECNRKLESYDRELASARRNTTPNPASISHLESEMKWQRDELVLQQRKERDARETLKRELERIQTGWDKDIRVAIAKQDDCNRKIEGLGRELVSARAQAAQDKAASDRSAADAASKKTL